MNKILLVLFSIIILTMLFVGFLAYSWYGIQQNSQPKVRITDFVADMGWFNPVGVTMGFFFYVTVENYGDENISDIQVTVQRLTSQNSSVSGNYPMVNIGVLQPAEIRNVTVDFFFGLQSYGEYSNSNYLAILSINGSTVLDEKKLN